MIRRLSMQMSSIAILGSALFSCAGLRPVPFETGAVDYKDGDSITIKRVRCEGAMIAPGARCEVTGRYVLRSHDKALLLFSVTTWDGGPTPVESSAEMQVTRGEGTFTLARQMVKGHPHVSLYDGESFGGVYFGHGDSLQRTQSWHH